LIEALE